jgi:hypothetical protein
MASQNPTPRFFRSKDFPQPAQNLDASRTVAPQLEHSHSISHLLGKRGVEVRYSLAP